MAIDDSIPPSLPLVVGVRLRQGGHVYDFDPGPLILHRDDRVLVETEHGPTIGTVATPPTRRPTARHLRRVVKKADARELALLLEVLVLARELRATALRTVRSSRLPVKLVKVETAFDGSRTTVFIAADDKIEQMMQSMGGQGGGAGGPGMPGMKPPKPDINTVATDVFQLKKMFLHDLRSRGVEMPPDILDGPNRDPQTGMPTQTPMGGSDPSVGAMPGGGGGPGGPPGGGGPAPQSAIKPMQPMQGAFPSPAGPGKMAAVKEDADIYKVGSEFKTARGLANRASQLAQAWHKIHREKVAS
jgi:hypothetical protein